MILPTTSPPGGTPSNSLYGTAPPERGTFFRFQVYEGVGTSKVEVHGRVGKYVISVVKRPKRANRYASNGCEKVEKTFWFCGSSHFKDGKWGTSSLRNGKKRVRGHSRPQSPSLQIKPRGSGDENGYGLDLGAEPSRKILC